ncbi:UNVERIFIED_CONTAM: hypothetical protein RMT77_016793 [Armadillidium vulgare]
MKKILFLQYFIIFIFFSFYFVLLKDFYQGTPFQNQDKSKMETQKSHKEVRNEGKKWKKILIWTDFFSSRNIWNSIFKRIIAGECEVNKCKVLLDRREIRKADAVIFNGYNLRRRELQSSFAKIHIHNLPHEKLRSPEQIYVFYSMEPPHKADAKYLQSMPPHFFNWTMGYRKDSDVFEPFARVIPKSLQDKGKAIEYFSQEELSKRKLLVWIGSSCYKNEPFIRESFIELLRKEHQFDVLGLCGTPCDDYSGLNIYGSILGENPCDLRIQDYAFYLALENSLCKDYVTEKMFKAWYFDVIPIVIGGANYSSFAPPKSYIDYKDFKSPSHLIEYLKKVANDVNLYNEYFKWKEDYYFEIGSPYNPMVCDLCKKLHDHSIKRETKSYKNIHDWFVTKSKCKQTIEEYI